MYIHINIIYFLSITCYYSVTSDTYNVNIETAQHVNLVDSKFLSFTVDPKYLFSSSDKYSTKESICMASSLTPAYIRIAGPSTAHMTPRNTTIAIDEWGLKTNKIRDGEGYSPKLAVTHDQWKKFVRWAKKTGFDLVFALNNEEKTSSGMWDPNTALKILTVADQAKIGDIYWQLGYECTNQSIEEYLNDLETLRVIIETFPSGKLGKWKIVGGDVTHCLHADSKSDFKDYVTLSDDMMDAILLNGNSSSQELERMSNKDRLKLLSLLSRSTTPLWLTEHSLLSAPQSPEYMLSELGRVSDWMASLGYSARNGFSVNYRELVERELYEPTLSFYMALLFKNLVGDRVLNVTMASSQAILFGHCTSLRQRPVRGAITLYGANMDDEAARFSIKLTKKEEGGDIMQFILGHDSSGNIVVNNHAMYYQGDIRPVVKRVRPYKTLVLNLPPKSFGFWVLANTKVEACFEEKDLKSNTKASEVSSTSKDDLLRTRRSINVVTDYLRANQDISDVFVDGMDNYEIGEENKALKERIDRINDGLRKVQRIFKTNSKSNKLLRAKRQSFLGETERLSGKIKQFYTKARDSLKDELSKNNLVQKISKFSKGHISRLRSNTRRPRNNKRNYKNKSKRNLNEININLKEDQTPKDATNLVRKRRNIKAKSKNFEAESSENEILDSKEAFRFEKMLNKLKKISDLPIDVQQNSDYEENSSEGIIMRTKVSDDSAVINISDKSHTGLLKSTLKDVMSLLADFNKNINKIWTAVTLFE